MCFSAELQGRAQTARQHDQRPNEKRKLGLEAAGRREPADDSSAGKDIPRIFKWGTGCNQRRNKISLSGGGGQNFDHTPLLECSPTTPQLPETLLHLLSAMHPASAECLTF